MAKSKKAQRGKSASTDQKHEPLTIEIRFDAPPPPPPAFPGTEPAVAPAKKTDGPKRPPLFFRF